MITETMMARAAWASDPFAEPVAEDSDSDVVPMCQGFDSALDDDGFCRGCEEYSA